MPSMGFSIERPGNSGIKSESTEIQRLDRLRSKNMWSVAYFIAWVLKLCGYSAPYIRFAGVKRRPKTQPIEAEGFWHSVVVGTLVLGFCIWMASHGIFNKHA